MNISVTFRNTEGEEWYKQYVSERIEKLKKYLDHPVDARVVLSVEKFRNVAEINLSDNGLNVNAKEEAKEMQQAIDNAVEKIERQLKKHKEKIRDHKGNSKGEELSASPVEDLDEAAEGSIAETRRMVLKHMASEDAVLELETTKSRFFLYRDSSTECVCLIYRRDDGRYGLIETNS